MESLNMYASDGESDSSTSMVVPRKSTNFDEVDANCEPITMDMSEDSSNGLSDHGDNEERDTNNVKRQYSKSLSTSPATSYSSDSSKGRDEDSKTDSSKSKRYDDDRRDDGRRSKHDRDYRHDDDRDRRRRDDRRDRRRHRDDDRYGAKKHERRRHRSRSRSQSPLARRNSRSYRQKNRSRSRDRSYDRHQRKNSPNRNNGRRKSPYRSRRSRSRTRSRSPRDKPRPKNWKSTSKMKVLEKLGIELKVPPVVVEPPPAGSNPTITNPPSQLTPQMLLQKTMEEQVEKVKTATGIALPAYYNPMAVNPTKYAEQIQKRRLLWGNKDKPANNPPPEEKKVIPAEAKGAGTIWQGATFGGDQDGKMTAKFQRLMGIKNANAAAVPEPKKDGTDLIKKQEEMFNSMESQYEVARLATHTHRGVGLGFGTFQPR